MAECLTPGQRQDLSSFCSPQHTAYQSGCKATRTPNHGSQGPVDIVVVNDRIVEIKVVGAPLLAIDEDNRPALEGGRELDVSGMYVLPGFIDSHLHLHSNQSGQNVPPDYVLKLWLSHGVTSGRTVGGDHGTPWEVAVAKKLADNEIMQTLLDRDFALSPTFTAYLTSRDFMRMSRAKWHEKYTMPELWDFYRPDRDAHGSYWFYWTLEDEVEWKHNFRLWMTFVNEYKNRGGKVSVGSDSGYIYNLYGFGTIMEMHLLREAGFTPLEVIHAATLVGAKVVGIDDEVGSIRVGKKADFVLVEENPLANLHVLFGTGTIKLNDETGEVERVGGVRYTIKDGIIYDIPELLKKIRDMVRAQKQLRGIPEGPMPIETVPSKNW